MINNKIKKIILSASENVPYYNNLFIENGIDPSKIDTYDDFSKIPLTSKDDIRRLGLANFLNYHYVDEKGFLIETSDMSIKQTSGTTGEPMTVPWHSQEYHASLMNHWKLRYERAGILPTDKMCFIWYTDDRLTPYCLSGNKFGVNRARLHYYSGEKYLRAVIDFKPKWLYLSPSILAFLVMIAKNKNIPLNNIGIEYIELATEPVIPYYRKIIEDYFNKKVYDMYGCQETNGIAFECSEGNLHIINNNVFVEIIDNDGNILPHGKEGNVCVTGLFNTLFPVIRYKLRDTAILNTSNCQCGNKYECITLSSFRLPEILMLNDKNITDKGLILYPLKRFNLENCENGFLFNLQMNESKNYKISFINLNKNDFFYASKLFREIFKAYGLGVDLKFAQTDVPDDTYRVGFLSKYEGII